MSSDTDTVITALEALTIYEDGEGMLNALTHPVIVAAVMHMRVQEVTIKELQAATIKVSQSPERRKRRLLPWSGKE